MFITNHAAIATIIGRFIPNPFVAFFAGMLSHFVFDMIPHGDEGMGKKFFGHRLKILKDQGDLKFLALYGTIDSFFFAIYLILLFRNFDFARSDAVIACIIGAIIPDVIAVIYKLADSRLLRWFNRIHSANHRYLVEKLRWDWPLQYAIVMQLCVLTIIIWIVSML